MLKVILVVILFVIALFAVMNKPFLINTVNPSPISTPYPTLVSRTLPQNYHVFQTFNNCGPAALSMALSYYDISVSQKTLGEVLRPYQVKNGDNDDKSVTLFELGRKAEEYNLNVFHRPNGSIDLIKRAVSAGYPVITRTLLKKDDDIGHYRVVKGYDDTSGKIIQDDSLEGANLTFSYNDFEKLWSRYNYEFLILLPKENTEIANAILLENFDKQKSWEIAAARSEKKLTESPSDIYEGFNYSVALFYTGNYEKSVLEFEKVENTLSFRTLWYQIEPIKSYFKMGNYKKVLSITQKILDNQNRAFSELYILRGDSLKLLGRILEARQEYEKALFYNKNLPEAKSIIVS